MGARVEDTRTFFDGRARAYYEANYEKPRDRHAFNLTLRRDACIALLDDQQDVLDLGCGPGAMTIPLLAEGRRVVATDISREMVAATLAQARRREHEVPVAVADAGALPFADRSFDAVVTTGVLEYVPDLAAVMREIHRVTRPGGIAIATMTLPRRFERLAARTYARAKGNETTVRQTILGRHEFDRAVEDGGFTIDKRHSCTFAPFPLDALWPPSVVWIDRLFGRQLNKVPLACDHAKTYIVRGRRS